MNVCTYVCMHVYTQRLIHTVYTFLMIMLLLSCSSDRAKRHIDALFNSRRAEEITNQLILHHMDVNATMDVFFGCMEFYWTQLGNMLADVPLPSSRDE